MALFDRRLLSFLDATAGPGRTTVLDRMAECQRDLAEIERELCKYQLLLGSHCVKFKPRTRDAWIAKNRTQPSIKERYREAARAWLSARDYEDEEDIGSCAVVDDAGIVGGGTLDVHAISQPGHAAQVAGPRSKPEDAGRARGSLSDMHDKTQADHANQSGSFRSKPDKGRRSQSKPADDDVVPVTSAGSASSNTKHDVGGGRVSSTVWVQIDTLFGLLPPGRVDRNYVVQAVWHDTGGRMIGDPQTTDWRMGRTMPERPGRDECVIRQQLKLEGVAGGRHVSLAVLGEQDEVVGSLLLDVFDSANHEIANHALRDSRGRQTGATVTLRLQAPAGLQGAGPSPSKQSATTERSASPTPSGPSEHEQVVCQDHTAAHGSRRASAVGVGGGGSSSRAVATVEVANTSTSFNSAGPAGRRSGPLGVDATPSMHLESPPESARSLVSAGGKSSEVGVDTAEDDDYDEEEEEEEEEDEEEEEEVEDDV